MSILHYLQVKVKRDYLGFIGSSSTGSKYIGILSSLALLLLLLLLLKCSRRCSRYRDTCRCIDTIGRIARIHQSRPFSLRILAASESLVPASRRDWDPPRHADCLAVLVAVAHQHHYHMSSLVAIDTAHPVGCHK
jgi:hypothetical protein